jgi:hypothetical protein
MHLEITRSSSTHHCFGEAVLKGGEVNSNDNMKESLDRHGPEATIEIDIILFLEGAETKA